MVISDLGHIWSIVLKGLRPSKFDFRDCITCFKPKCGMWVSFYFTLDKENAQFENGEEEANKLRKREIKVSKALLEYMNLSTSLLSNNSSTNKTTRYLWIYTGIPVKLLFLICIFQHICLLLRHFFFF